tara:strand:+ start:2506 stop:2883 length:378 start_codon:yes stop_codon:yes gene_type:complete
MIFTLAMSAMVLVSAANTASRQVMSENDYEAAIKEIRLTLGDMRGHIDARYWPELDTQIGRLETFFDQIELFWNNKESDDGVKFSRAAKEQLTELSSASENQDQPGCRESIARLQEAYEDLSGVT